VSGRTKKNQSNRVTQKSNVQQLATLVIDQMAKGGARKLKSVLGLNTEDKFVDTAGTTTTTSTLASRIASPTIAQGLTVNTRQGTSIRVTKCELRINISAIAAATLGNTIRVIVVRSNDDSTITLADVLQTTTDISSPIHNLFSAHGLELLDDFTVQLSTTAGGESQRYVKRTYSNDDWHMVWTDADTTGVPSNLVTGCMQVFWYAENSGNPPTFVSNMRTWFVDN